MADPSTLSGKALWLRAKDLGANGSSVTTWADQSGNSRDATSSGTAPTVATAATPGGGKAVSFGGSGYLALPNLGFSGVGSAISASGQNLPNEGVAKLFDGSASTKWLVATSTAWVQFRTTTAVAPASYTITSGNDAAERDPKNWTLYGSSDGSTWTSVDVRTGETWSGRGQARTFSITGTTPYTYWKWDITLNNGGTLIQASEFSFTGASVDTGAKGEIWVVIKATKASGTVNPLWNIQNASLTSDYTRGNFFPDTSATQIYESFGRSGRLGFTVGSSVLNTWRLYRVADDGSAYQAWLDGSLAVSSSSVPITDGTNNALGTAPGNFGNFQGQIAEVLVRSTASTGREAVDLITYFNAEHGLGITVPDTTQAYTSAVLGDNPVGYWKMERIGATSSSPATLADSSGNGRDLTNSGIWVGASPAASIPGYSADLGSGSGAASYTSSSWFASLTQFSVEAWINTSANSTQDRDILSVDDLGTPGSSTRKFRLYMQSGRLIIMAYTTAGGYPFVQSPASPLYSDGAWHHVVGTCDGTTLRLYVDGALVGSQAMGGTLVTGNTVPLWIGRNAYAGSYRWYNLLDEVALYGTALSSTQVAAHYTAATTSGAAILSGSATLVAASTLSASGSVARTGSVALAASSSLSASGATSTPTVTGSAALAAASSLSASGAVVPATVTGVVGATIAPHAAAITGTVDTPNTGTVAATMPAHTAAIAGTVAAPPVTGAVAATIPAHTALITGTVPTPAVTGTVAAVTPAHTAAITGVRGALPGMLELPLAMSGTPISLDFSTAANIDTDPPVALGDDASRDLWLTLTPSSSATLELTFTGFNVGTEVWVGPPNAGPDDITRLSSGGTTLATPLSEGLVYYVRVHPLVASETGTGSLAWSATTRDTDVQLSVQASIYETPGWLGVSVSSATPGGTLEFRLPSGTDTIDSDAADDTGQAVGTSVELPVLVPGTYVLTVLDVATGREASGSFQVLDESFEPDPLPSASTPTAPAVVARWQLENPAPGGEVFTFPINPNRMSSPYANRLFTSEHTTSPAGQPLTFEGQAMAADWTVEGSCITQAFYEALERFQALHTRLFLTDHLGRVWVVTFESLEWTRLRDPRNDWAHSYRLKMLVFDALG